MDVTPQLVSALLDYDPSTGLCWWKDHLMRRAKGGRSDVIGKNAGHYDGKYWRISIYGKGYLRSRIAWCIMTGQWPVYEIDHKNRCKTDDRWNNLREVTNANQNRNVRYVKRVHHGLPTGIFPSRNRTGWIARWHVDKIRKESKVFYALEEAVAFRTAKLKELGLDQYSPRQGG